MHPRCLALLALPLASACVSQQVYDRCRQDLDAARTELTTCTGERDHLRGENDGCQIKLTDAVGQNQQLIGKLSAMGENVETLLGQKDKLAQERADLAARVEELARLRTQAEQRNADYRKLMSRLAKMIDAGTLQVKIRNGNMLVQVSNDLLFPSGGIKLKPEARQAIVELTETLKSFPDRRFQVLGHSDSSPINSVRFPSNWELSAERAIEVVKVMLEVGMSPTNVNAAGHAEFDPLFPNDTAEHKAANRRVELIFLPKLDELPGFAELNAPTPGTSSTGASMTPAGAAPLSTPASTMMPTAAPAAAAPTAPAAIHHRAAPAAGPKHKK